MTEGPGPAFPALPDLPAPSLARRMAALIYEGVLLFGVLMVFGYLFSSLTQQRNAMVGRHGLQAFLFVVLGVYFGWFWSHGGQTVAMKAWHVRLVSRDGSPVSQARALGRYLLSWLWFLPALSALWLQGIRSLGGIFGLLLLGVVGYAALARFLPRRQFLHDWICGTRLVLAESPSRRAQSPA
jgi:uncharacterized RDD family membrane protein YckC